MTYPAFRYIGEPSPKPILRTGPDANGHFEGQALHLISRIRDHVERLDNGASYAVDDLAVALRAMLHHARGNRVLARLSSLCGRADIQVKLSRPPAYDNSHFSVGSIPTSAAMAEDHGASWVPLEKWPSRPLLRIVKGGEPVTYTWGDFLNTYANKWGGAHLDHEVPAHLQVVDLYDVGGFALSGYLLRSAAVQVWLIAQAVLADAFVVLRGQPLSREDLMGARLGSEGALLDDPMDRRPFGELQWLDYRQRQLDLLMYVERDRPANLTLQAGSMAWQLKYAPPADEGESSASPILRARQPIRPALKSSDFSGHTLSVNGRFLTFDEVDS